jgi:hypothetical protein
MSRRKTMISNEFTQHRDHIDINGRGKHRAIIWTSYYSMELEAYPSLFPSKSKNDPKLTLFHTSIFITII